jgi:hypothetical protein
MAEPTLEDVRAVLRERADDVLVPAPPLAEVARLAAAGRRRRALVATAVVAGLAAVVAGFVVLAGPQEQRPPTGTPTAPAVDDLPTGGPSHIAYVVGRTLYVGSLTLSLEAPVSSLSQVGSEVLVGYDNGRLMLVRTSPVVLKPDVVASDAGSAVLSPAGDYVAYQRRTGDGSIVLVVRSIDTGDELVQRVPGTDDGSLQVDGITSHGVIASQPLHGRIWWWRVELSDGAGPLRSLGLHRVTGIDPSLEFVDRIYDGHLVLAGNVALVVGDVREDGRFVESRCCRAVRGLRTTTYDFDEPADERVAFARDGLLYVRRLRSMKDRTLMLPRAVDVQAVRWEDEDHVLVMGVVSTRSVLLRCSTTGRCETVADVGGDTILLAR